MPIIDKILENKKLQKDAVYNKTKDSFDNLTNSKVDELAKHLIDVISEKIQINKITGYRNTGEYPDDEKLFYHPDKVKPDTKKTNCTIQASEIKEEEILERMIKIASGCNNQVPIPDLKKVSHIDLAIKDKDTTTINIIELKKWDNENDNPCYTIAENIKNLYMLLHLAYHYNPENKYKYRENILSGDSDDKNNDKKFYDINGVKKFILTILAPEKYFELHFSNDKLKEKYKKFCLELEKCIKEDLRRKLNKEDLEIKIEIKQIGLTYIDFEKIRKTICQKEGSKVKDIDGKISVKLSEYEDDFIKYKKKLTEWEDVIK